MNKWPDGRCYIFRYPKCIISQEEESDDDAVTAQPQSGASHDVSGTQQPIFAMPAPGSAAAPTSTANESTNLNSGGERVIYTTGITSSLM